MLRLNGSQLGFGLAALLAISGCHRASLAKKNKAGATLPAKIVATQKAPAVVATETGAQLWAQNCVRCHNVPPPGDYNDAQWHVIMFHMQQRANLTDVQRKKILKFLLSDNK